MTPSATTTSRPITILLVDDDPDCRMLIRDIIAQAAARADVREVADGREAMDYLRRVGPFAGAPRPDLIYLDMEMPGLSGPEVLQAVKSDPHLRGIRVVMLTGIDDPARRADALGGGADSYVVKPVDPGRFLRIVGSSVRFWARARRPAGPEGQADEQ